MARTVLVVDDTPTNLSVLFDVLHEEGYRVLVAESGEAALRRLERVMPDVILLDLMMPGMDGFETLAAIREQESLREIPVLFMTAVHETESKVRALQGGAVDYITKPFQQEEVLARIETHLMLRELRQALEQELIAKDALISDLEAYSHTVAHDLKSPLAGVMSGVELLAMRHSKDLPDGSVKMLDMLTRSCVKMNSIIRELLLLASVRKQEAPREPVDPLVVLREAWARLAAVVDSRKARLTLPDEIPAVRGYAPWLEEVFANLLSNAVKYGGEPPLVEVEFSSIGAGRLRIDVRDNGKGLTAEEQKTVLEPFSQLDRKRAEGHGLGLPIVRRILEKIGGELGIESEAGCGSTFFVVLPSLDSTTAEATANLTEVYPAPVGDSAEN